jgi:WD40 repeat protein
MSLLNKRRRSFLGSLREKQLGQPRQRRIYPPLCSPSCMRLLHSEIPKRLRRHCAQVTCAAVLPDGTLFGDGGANSGGNGGDTTVVLSADGGGWVHCARMVLTPGGSDAAAATTKLLFRAKAHEGSVNTMQLVRGGGGSGGIRAAFTAGDDGLVKCWSLDGASSGGGSGLALQRTLDGHESYVTALAHGSNATGTGSGGASSPHLVASGSLDGCIFLWDERVRSPIAELSTTTARAAAGGSGGGAGFVMHSRERVLSLQFAAHMGHDGGGGAPMLMCCSESACTGGMVMLWDLRRLGGGRAAPLQASDLPGSGGGGGGGGGGDSGGSGGDWWTAAVAAEHEPAPQRRSVWSSGDEHGQPDRPSPPPSSPLQPLLAELRLSTAQCAFGEMGRTQFDRFSKSYAVPFRAHCGDCSGGVSYGPGQLASAHILGDGMRLVTSDVAGTHRVWRLDMLLSIAATRADRGLPAGFDAPPVAGISSIQLPGSMSASECMMACHGRQPPPVVLGRTPGDRRSTEHVFTGSVLDCAVQVSDLSDGSHVCTLPQPNERDGMVVSALALSDDGRALVSGDTAGGLFLRHTANVREDPC